MRLLTISLAIVFLSSSSILVRGDSNSHVEVSNIQLRDTVHSSVSFKSGDTIELTVSLKTINHNIFNVFATVSASDPCISFIQDNASFSNLIVDSSINNSNNPFVFTIAQDCEVKTQDFKMTVTGSDGFHQDLTFTGGDQAQSQSAQEANFVLEVKAINGVVNKDPDLDRYEAGAKVVLKAVYNEGYEFSDWIGDFNDKSNPLTILMDSNKSLIANFKSIVEEKPLVDAGKFQEVTLPSKVILRGTTSLDEKRGLKIYSWCQLSGPGVITYANPYSLITTASFSRPGVYMLLLTAVDKSSGNSGNSKLIIKVNKEIQKDRFFNVF